MIELLESPFLRFGCDPAAGCFDLESRVNPALRMQSGRVGAQAFVNRKALTLLAGAWQPLGECLQAGPHGRLHVLEYQSSTADLAARISFALCDDRPLFLWRVRLENRGTQPAHVRRITLLECGARFPGSLLETGAGELAFFAQGWQSWSHTAAYGADQRQTRSRLNFLEGPMYVNAGTTQTHGAGHFSADFYGVLGSRRARSAWLAGFLSQREHFGSLEAWLEADSASLAMWANGDDALLEAGAALETDWAVLAPVSVDHPDPLGIYLDSVARENQIPTLRDVPAGWCSWYYLYQKVTAEDVRRNLVSVQQMRPTLPLEMIQVDDGFQAQLGDWLTPKPAFAEGMDILAAEIRAAGMTPGLWLAPFLAHPRSALYRDHPDWLLRNRNGQPVYALFNWNARMTALDPTHPGALAYITRVIETAARRWGYTYLKLDFLYAGGLPGCHHDPRLTRAQVLRRALDAIREAVGPETILLGCGVPLGSALGVMDAVRIGADTGESWTPRPYGIQRLLDAEPNLPALRNAMQNPLTRADLHARWWVNDPDCLLARPDTALTLDEVRAQATLIALSGGALLLSDDLPALPPERRRIVEALLPHIGLRPRVLDWFDRETPRKMRLDLSGAAGDWSLLAWFNFDDTPADFALCVEDFGLPTGAYWLREFWSGSSQRLEPGASACFAQEPAHGVVLLAARRCAEGAPQYLGGDLHIAQGIEVSTWSAKGGELRLGLALPRHVEGCVELYLVAAPRQAWLDGAEIPLTALGNGVYRAGVAFENETELRIVM